MSNKIAIIDGRNYNHKEIIFMGNYVEVKNMSIFKMPKEKINHFNRLMSK